MHIVKWCNVTRCQPDWPVKASTSAQPGCDIGRIRLIGNAPARGEADLFRNYSMFGGVLNPAFTMSEDSVNQNCFSAADSMF